MHTLTNPADWALPSGRLSSANLRCAWHGVAPSDVFTGGEFTSLLTSLPQATVFTTSEWLSTAYSLLHKRRTPRILTCRTRDDVVAIVPLTHGVESFRGVPLRTLRGAGFPLSDRMPLLIADRRVDLVPTVLDGLVAGDAPWDVIILNEIPREPAIIDAVTQWSRDSGYKVMFRLASRAPVLPLRAANRESLLSSYPRALAARLRRCRKKLAAAGRVEFRRVLAEPGQVRPLLNELKAVEDSSWKGQQGVGIFSTPENQAFFTTVSARMAEREWLDIGLLYLDGRLISYRYGFRFAGAFWDYNLAHRPEYNHLSPGRVLLDEMIQSSLDLGLTAVDASRGSLTTGNLLQDWTDQAIECIDLKIFNRSLPGTFARVADTWVRPLIRSLRGIPAPNTVWTA